MDDLSLVGLIGALVGTGGIGVLVDRFLLRKPVTAKIAAETRSMDATTTQTITSIVEGLLVTMQAELAECAEGHAETRKELGQVRSDLASSEERLASSEGRVADLEAEMVLLTERLTVAEQQENQ